MAVIYGTNLNDNGTVNWILGAPLYLPKLTGTFSGDIIYGLEGDDILDGLAGNDDLRGGGGNDVIYGGQGRYVFDSIYSVWRYISGGDDVLSGGGGNDIIYGGDGSDLITGAEGSDLLFGESGSDMIVGYFGDDFLSGGSENDYLEGGSNNDYLEGGNGDDELIGYYEGVEYDTLTGGVGADLFILGDNFDAAFYTQYDQGTPTFELGYAVITDFKWWEGDKIQLKGNASQYSLTYGNVVGGAAQDTILSYNNPTLGIDYMAVFQDTTDPILSLDVVFV